MKTYSNEALTTIQEETAKLCTKLVNTKPTDDLTLDDIQALRYYIQAFQNAARTEEYRRKIALIKNRK